MSVPAPLSGAPDSGFPLPGCARDAAVRVGWDGGCRQAPQLPGVHLQQGHHPLTAGTGTSTLVTATRHPDGVGLAEKSRPGRVRSRLRSRCGFSAEPATGLGGKRCPGSRGRRSTGWCGKCCPGNGSGQPSCCGGLRIRRTVTNGPNVPCQAPRRHAGITPHPSLN